MGSEKQAQGDPYEHTCILNFIPDLDPVSTVRTCHQSLQVIAAFVVGWSFVDFLWRMLQHTNWDIPVQNRNWGCTKQCNWNTHVHKAEHLEYTCAKQKLGLYKIQHNWNTHVHKTSGIYLCKTETGAVQNTQQLEIHVHKAKHLEYTCAKQELGQCKTHSNWNICAHKSKQLGHTFTKQEL